MCCCPEAPLPSVCHHCIWLAAGPAGWKTAAPQQSCSPPSHRSLSWHLGWANRSDQSVLTQMSSRVAWMHTCQGLLSSSQVARDDLADASEDGYCCASSLSFIHLDCQTSFSWDVLGVKKRFLQLLQSKHPTIQTNQWHLTQNMNREFLIPVSLYIYIIVANYSVW